MKQWLFTPKLNRFDMIALIAYFAALKHVDFGLNVPTVLIVGAFFVAAMFSAEMQEEVEVHVQRRNGRRGS